MTSLSRPVAAVGGVATPALLLLASFLFGSARLIIVGLVLAILWFVAFCLFAASRTRLQLATRDR